MTNNHKKEQSPKFIKKIKIMSQKKSLLVKKNKIIKKKKNYHTQTLKFQKKKKRIGKKKEIKGNVYARRNQKKKNISQSNVTENKK